MAPLKADRPALESGDRIFRVRSSLQRPVGRTLGAARSTDWPQEQAVAMAEPVPEQAVRELGIRESVTPAGAVLPALAQKTVAESLAPAVVGLAQKLVVSALVQAAAAVPAVRPSPQPPASGLALGASLGRAAGVAGSLA